MDASVVGGIGGFTSLLTSKLKEVQCVPSPWPIVSKFSVNPWFLVASSRNYFQISSSLWQALKVWACKEQTDVWSLLSPIPLGCGKDNGLRSLVLILCNLPNTSFSNPFSESEARWSSRLSNWLCIEARGDLKAVLSPIPNWSQFEALFLCPKDRLEKEQRLKTGHSYLPPLFENPADWLDSQKKCEILGLSILELWLLRRTGIGKRKTE